MAGVLQLRDSDPTLTLMWLVSEQAKESIGMSSGIEFQNVAAEIATAMVELQQKYQLAFGLVEKLDPDLAVLVIQAFGSRTKAVRWFCRAHGTGKESPLDLLAAGRRDEVIEKLVRIEHGIFG